MSAFTMLLQRHRERLDLSQNALARAAAVDNSYIHRLLKGDREPPRRYIVERLAVVLQLDQPDADRLMLAAGYAPDWLMALAGVARITPREATPCKLN